MLSAPKLGLGFSSTGFLHRTNCSHGAGWHTGLMMEPLSPALNAPRCYCCHCTAFNEQASGPGEINGFLYFFFLREQNSPLCSQLKAGDQGLWALGVNGGL